MIDVAKRKNQIEEYNSFLQIRSWSNDISTESLLTLAEIVRKEKNKKDRWTALKASDAATEIPNESKTVFDGEIEPAVRNYTKAARDEPLDGDLVRWAITIGKTVNYRTLDDFDNAIEDYITNEIPKMKSHREKIQSDLDSIDFFVNLGGVIGIAIVLVPLFAIVLFFMGAFDPSPEEIARKEGAARASERQQIEICKQDLRESISRSCQSDPVFSYCSLNYDSHEILGSGCTGRVKRQGSHAAQVQFCKQESLSSVGRTCAIEIYGCAAVTGNVNC